MLYFLAPLSAAFAFVALTTALLVRRDRRLAHRPPADRDEPYGLRTPGP
ncbi:hypothetical protein AB0L75_05525 [Streptomyces sp. NPDC052101]